MSLHSPVDFAQIVDSYIDGYRKNGWMPECRANNLPGWTQGGALLRSDLLIALPAHERPSSFFCLQAQAEMSSWDISRLTTTTRLLPSESTSMSSTPRKSRTARSTLQNGTFKVGK